MRSNRIIQTVNMALLAGLLGCSTAVTPPSLESLTGEPIAIVNDSRIVYTHAFGVKNKETGEPVDTSTVFSGASFSKTVFAWIAMQLVEESVLDPLS